jgi:hypothetical protein
MTPLDDLKKQLLFDYCLGLTSEEQTVQAEALISSSKEASEITSKLKAALAPLESLDPEPCPDELAESTIGRLNNLARSSQLQLQQLLAAEQSQQTAAKNPFWLNLGRRLATAAVFMIAGSILITSLNFARQKYWRHQCQMQLSRISQGINRYSNDHNGKMPAVAAATGAPWWKVGYQGNENHSNTRPVWLLVKGNYVNPADFICPATGHRKILQLDNLQLKNYNDFPNRKYITYSFRIQPHKSQKQYSPSRKVLTADLNPLFEKLPRNYSAPLKLQLNKGLLTINSANHNRRGQNVLFGDGRVKFIKRRCIGISEDDIFTLQNTNIYQGSEVPSSDADAFLAP